jgi:hypothetical protein
MILIPSLAMLVTSPRRQALRRPSLAVEDREDHTTSPTLCRSNTPLQAIAPSYSDKVPPSKSDVDMLCESD